MAGRDSFSFEEVQLQRVRAYRHRQNFGAAREVGN